MKQKVFIAHSSLDHDFVLKLAEKLRKESIDVWIDDWEIKVGDSITGKINKGLQDSGFFIIVLSKNSIKSNWVNYEINSTTMMAINNKNLTVLPVLYGDITYEEIPPLLRHIFSIKFESDIIEDEKFRKLIEPIKNKQKEKILQKYQDDFLKTIEHIDKIVEREEPSKYEIEFILNTIKENHYFNYFIKKAKFIDWFYILKECGYFSPEHHPKNIKVGEYYKISFWEVLNFLERISQQKYYMQDRGVINDLLKIIQDVSKYKKNGKHIDNYRTWYYFTRILCNIPNEYINKEILKLIDIWLTSDFDTTLQGSEIATKLFPKFLTDEKEDIKKAELIFKYITAPHKKSPEKLLSVDFYWLKEMLEKYSEEIGKKCSIKILNTLINHIKKLEIDEYTGTYYSFYDELKYDPSDSIGMLIYMVKVISSEMIKYKANELCDFVRKLFRFDGFLFQKIGLYIIGQDISKFRKLFFELLESEKAELIFSKTLYFGDELKKVLESLKSLSNNEKKLLKEKIELGSKEYKEELRSDLTEEEKDKEALIQKQEIYNALSYDQEFKNLYEQLKLKTGVDAILQPAVRFSSVSWVGNKSPLSTEEILNRDNKDLVSYLKEFKGYNVWEEPNIEGLAQHLKEIAKDKPDKFIDDLTPFKDTPYLYMYYIFWGLSEAIKQKNYFNWERLLEFLKQYLSNNDFWNNKYVIQNGFDYKADRSWVVGQIADLIKEGLKDNQNPLKNYMDDAYKIIKTLLDKETCRENKIIDYLTHSINCPYGKSIEVFISWITANETFDEERKSVFQNILYKRSIDGYVYFGMYLPNLYIFDKEWTQEILKRLENEQKEPHWQGFMEGYLSDQTVYDILYDSMKSHYSNALSFNFEGWYGEIIVQHVCLFYLMEKEKIDEKEGLFNQILEDFKSEQLIETINFFWQQKKYLMDDKNKIEKILKFWEVVFEKIKNKGESLTKEDKIISANLLKLTDYLDPDDENKWSSYQEWLLFSGKYLNEDYVSYEFIKGLNKIAKKGKRDNLAKDIGEIFKDVLKANEDNLPVYKEEDIKSLVEYLYNKGAKVIADEICNIYAKQGYFFLREIYEKNQRN